MVQHIYMYIYQQQQKFHTFHEHSLGLVRIFEADKQSLGKGVDHGEYHPDLDQLDVGGGWQSLADSEKTETFTFFKMLPKKHPQCGENKHDCEVDLDDHVKVLLSETIHHLAQEDQHCSWKIYLTHKRISESWR